MKNIYYIDDNYTPATKSALESARIKMPQFNTPYTIRDVYIHNGIYHLLLNEIVNGKIGTIEPGFAYYRFTDVPGNVLCWETVTEFLKNKV